MLGIKTLKDGWNGFEYQLGLLFIKMKNGKCIGKSRFEIKENGWEQIVFKDYSYLSGEDLAPPQEMIDIAVMNFDIDKPLPSWFNLKTMLLSEILTEETTHTPTVTTKQMRIPNSGIIMESFEPDYYLSMEELQQQTIWDF